MSDFVGRVRSLVLTSKAREATVGFLVGKPHDLIYIKKKSFWMLLGESIVGRRKGNKEAN